MIILDTNVISELMRTEPDDAVAAWVNRERAGRPIGIADAQIAAICRSHHAAVATHNTSDFSGTGVDVINTWDHTPD